MRLVLLTAVLLISAAGGCTSPISYHPGDKPEVFRVHCGGQYDLYGCGEKDPRYVCILHAGESLGFGRDGHGRLVGLVEGDRIALPEREYRWVRVSRPPGHECPTDPVRLEDVYEFVFEDVLTPTFKVLKVVAPALSHSSG